MRKFSFALALSLALAGIAGTSVPAVAQKSPEKIRLTPQSKDGAVLLKVDTIAADHQLWFKKAGSSGFGSRLYMIKVGAGGGEEVYVARTLKPGRYRLDSVWQQNRWGLLLSGDTVEFEVRPGAITYLGKLETRDLLLTLQRDAVAAGKTVSVGTSGFSTDRHGKRPSFVARDDAGLADAAGFAARAMQASPAMVQLGLLHESRSSK